MKRCPAENPRSTGFTLVELMVSMGILSVLSIILVSITNSTASTWRYTTSRIEQFRGAETAFEGITRRLSQATLNTYWDYDSPSAPKRYLRKSELRFISGRMTGKPADKPLLTTTTPRRPTHGVFFQAPLGFVDDEPNFGGLENLLNTWGYYVEFDRDDRPGFLNTMKNPPPYRYRYRLMEFMQPSNSLALYQQELGQPFYSKHDWFSNPLGNSPPPTHVLAENVIALILLPKLSPREDPTGIKLAPKYLYDSAPVAAPPGAVQPLTENQLPPLIQATLVAIDESSAARLANGSTPPSFDATLDNLFSDASKLDADLTSLQSLLTLKRANVRIFTSNIGIRAAKWSKQ